MRICIVDRYGETAINEPIDRLAMLIRTGSFDSVFNDTFSHIRVTWTNPSEDEVTRTAGAKELFIEVLKYALTDEFKAAIETLNDALPPPIGDDWVGMGFC